MFHILTYALNSLCRPLWVVMIVEIFYRKCYVNCDKNQNNNYNITRDNDNSGKRKIVTELRKKTDLWHDQYYFHSSYVEISHAFNDNI